MDESLRRVEEDKLSIITARLKDTSIKESRTSAANSDGCVTQTESSERSDDGVPITDEIGNKGKEETDHIAVSNSVLNTLNG